jgi:hypothetical protein
MSKKLSYMPIGTQIDVDRVIHHVCLSCGISSPLRKELYLREALECSLKKRATGPTATEGVPPTNYLREVYETLSGQPHVACVPCILKKCHPWQESSTNVHWHRENAKSLQVGLSHVVQDTTGILAHGDIGVAMHTPVARPTILEDPITSSSSRR